MLKNEMIKEIIKNGGATLDYNYNNFNASAGYMVSLYGYETKININNIEAIKKEMETKKEIAKQLKAYIGLWVDNGLMYLDISKHIIDYNKALETARNNEQKAVYDLKNDKSIYLEYKKYYNLYKVIKDSNNNIVDYKLIKQYDKKEEIIKEMNASIKTINNIIYRNISQFEKRQKSYNNYILISDYITTEEIEL